MCNCHTFCGGWYLEHFLWNCPGLDAKWPHWWMVNIGSGNGLVPSGNNSDLPQWFYDNEPQIPLLTHLQQLRELVVPLSPSQVLKMRTVELIMIFHKYRDKKQWNKNLTMGKCTRRQVSAGYMMWWCTHTPQPRNGCSNSTDKPGVD